MICPFGVFDGRERDTSAAGTIVTWIVHSCDSQTKYHFCMTIEQMGMEFMFGIPPVWCCHRLYCAMVSSILWYNHNLCLTLVIEHGFVFSQVHLIPMWILQMWKKWLGIVQLNPMQVVQLSWGQEDHTSRLAMNACLGDCPLQMIHPFNDLNAKVKMVWLWLTDLCFRRLQITFHLQTCRCWLLYFMHIGHVLILIYMWWADIGWLRQPVSLLEKLTVLTC